VLVAEDSAGAVIGSVRGEMRGGCCLVGRLVVEPELQGRGIGRALAAALEARFAQAERFEIFTGHRSAPALHLYESLGYTRERTEYVHERLDLVFLSKLGTSA
jgi:ribosomal protein S18 acetylase RimI-like enzyme